MRYVAQACGETGCLAATKLVAPIGERRAYACFFNFGASLPRHRLQLAGFHPSLRASWPKNWERPTHECPCLRPPMSGAQIHTHHTFRVWMRRINTPQRPAIPGGCDKGDDRWDATRTPCRMPSRTGSRRDPLDLHDSPTWGRARKRRVTLLRSGHLRARVFRRSEVAGADQGNSTALAHSHDARALLGHRSPSYRTPIVAPANKNPAVPWARCRVSVSG